MRAYWSGFFLSETLDVWRGDAERVVAQGFTAFKARAGRPDLDEDDARIAALRGVLPANSVLMVDVNQAWDRERAIAGARRLARHNLAWLEDPLVHYDYPGLADDRCGSRRFPSPAARTSTSPRDSAGARRGGDDSCSPTSSAPAGSQAGRGSRSWRLSAARR